MFDSIGKKIAKTGQSAVQKTKDFTEEVRINSLIAEQEKQRNRLMQQLGNVYYEKYAESPLPELSEIVQSINSTNNTISEYREQIRKLKNIIACSACGKEMPYESQFCAKCGKPMQQPEADKLASTDANKCRSCGTALLPNAAFCNICGTRIPAPTEPKPQPPREKCPSCGAEILKDTIFCNRCGAKLAADNTPVKADQLISEPKPAIIEVVPEPITEEALSSIRNEQLQLEPTQNVPEYTVTVETEAACAYCGASLISGAMFCLTCGNAVAAEANAPAPAPENTCANCGKKLLEGAAFCLSCGKPVQEAAELPDTQLFCLKCGEKLIPEAAFCLKCGKKV